MSLLLPLFEKTKMNRMKKKVDSMQQFRLIRRDFDGLAQISWVHKKEIERKFTNKSNPLRNIQYLSLEK